MQRVSRGWGITLSGLLVLALAACNKDSGSGSGSSEAFPPLLDGTRVSAEDLAHWLDWTLELRQQVREAVRDGQAAPDDLQASVEVFERNRKRQTEVLAREPFKGSYKARAMAAVIHSLYASGTYFREEKDIERLRGIYGRSRIDSIVEHEALIRAKLDAK